MTWFIRIGITIIVLVVIVDVLLILDALKMVHPTLKLLE
jgi:hypothetical protein